MRGRQGRCCGAVLWAVLVAVWAAGWLKASWMEIDGSLAPSRVVDAPQAAGTGRPAAVASRWMLAVWLWEGVNAQLLDAAAGSLTMQAAAAPITRAGGQLRITAGQRLGPRG